MYIYMYLSIYLSIHIYIYVVLDEERMSTRVLNIEK